MSRNTEVQSFIVERIAALIGARPDEIDPAEELSVYGVDSSDLMTLVFDVEDKFAIKLHPGLFLKGGTISALAGQIASAL